MRRIQPRHLIPLALLLIMPLVLAACGDDQEEIGTVSVLHVWVSAGEPESLSAMVAPWEELTGGTVEDIGDRDLTAVLTARVAGGNPPDIAVLPNPGFMQELAEDGELVALDSFLDMDKIRREYSTAWIDGGTVDGTLFGIFMKADAKGSIWYNPKEFTANGYQVPATWEEMDALSDRIVAEGKNPWSIGVESGAASGWPGTDWIQNIILNEFGPDVFDQWFNNEIPWTDSRIKSAWERFGQVALTEGYVPGGADFILSTNFVNAAWLPYNDPPQAFMHHQASFAQDIIEGQFPNAVIGEDFSFFPFPTITPAYTGAITGGANVVVMLNDTESARSLMDYLASSAAQEIWVGRGGFTAVNNQISLDSYPNEMAAQFAELAVNAPIFRFDPDDLFAGALQTAYWAAILDYLGNPDQLDSILADLDAVHKQQ